MFNGVTCTHFDALQCADLNHDERLKFMHYTDFYDTYILYGLTVTCDSSCPRFHKIDIIRRYHKTVMPDSSYMNKDDQRSIDHRFYIHYKENKRFAYLTHIKRRIIFKLYMECTIQLLSVCVFFYVRKL